MANNPNPRDLTGRCALVTGGARRIGRALALALAGAGAKVVVHYNTSAGEAADLCEEIAALGSTAGAVPGDLADPSVCADLLARASGVIGQPLDILVNNASIFGQGSVRETTVEDWDGNQAVNLRAPFLLSRAFAAQVPEGPPADIINLNDDRVAKPGADHFAYTVSKVGLHGLTRSLALALAPSVRVNELALGAVLPPETAPSDYVHTLKADIPTGRFGSVAEVTDALLFLLGNPAFTGQTLYINGGRHLT